MSLDTFLAKLEKNNTRTFFLPILQEEVTYRKMDVIDSSVNNSLPNFLAARVLDAMKSSIEGDNENQPNVDKIKLNNDDIRDLLFRATDMWSKLVIEPKLSIDQINQVSSQDRLAWFLNAIAESQQTETEGGGVQNVNDVGNFPNKTRTRGNAKRPANS